MCESYKKADRSFNVYSFYAEKAVSKRYNYSWKNAFTVRVFTRNILN